MLSLFLAPPSLSLPLPPAQQGPPGLPHFGPGPPTGLVASERERAAALLLPECSFVLIIYSWFALKIAPPAPASPCDAAAAALGLQGPVLLLPLPLQCLALLSGGQRVSHSGDSAPWLRTSPRHEP